MGYKEGRMPVAGAIVVFWPGVDGVSSEGHVAYVEAVGPAAGIPPGDFKLSEMNFAGWNRVDYRVISNTSADIEGLHLRLAVAASSAWRRSSCAAGSVSMTSEASAPARSTASLHHQSGLSVDGHPGNRSIARVRDPARASSR